jgi:hypothetical protein
MLAAAFLLENNKMTCNCKRNRAGQFAAKIAIERLMLKHDITHKYTPNGIEYVTSNSKLLQIEMSGITSSGDFLADYELLKAYLIKAELEQ